MPGMTMFGCRDRHADLIRHPIDLMFAVSESIFSIPGSARMTRWINFTSHVIPANAGIQ